MKIFIINLKRGKDRKAFQIEQARKYQLEIEFIEAVDYKELNEETLENAANHWTRPITGKDVGCYHSHRKAWGAVINYGKPALIIEDDIVFSSSIKKILDFIESIDHPKNRVYDIEYAPVPHRISKRSMINNRTEDIILTKMHINKIGAGAYIIHPNTASKLLQEAKNYVMVDSYLWSRPWIEQIQVEPCPAAQMRDIRPSIDKESMDQNASPKFYPQKSFIKKKMIRFKLNLNQAKAAINYFFSGEKRHLQIKQEEFHI